MTKHICSRDPVFNLCDCDAPEFSDDPDALLHDPGDLPKGAVWLGLGAFLALVAIAGGFFWFIGRTRGAW